MTTTEFDLVLRLIRIQTVPRAERTMAEWREYLSIKNRLGILSRELEESELWADFLTYYGVDWQSAERADRAAEKKAFQGAEVRTIANRR